MVYSLRQPVSAKWRLLETPRRPSSSFFTARVANQAANRTECVDSKSLAVVFPPTKNVPTHTARTTRAQQRKLRTRKECVRIARAKAKATVAQPLGTASKANFAAPL